MTEIWRSPIVFGPPFWFVLHSVAQHYPESPSRDVRRACGLLLKTTPRVLPCTNCGKHFHHYLREREADLICATAGRDQLVEFLYQAHEAVRKRVLGPAFRPFDRDMMRVIYCRESIMRSWSSSDSSRDGYFGDRLRVSLDDRAPRTRLQYAIAVMLESLRACTLGHLDRSGCRALARFLKSLRKLSPCDEVLAETGLCRSILRAIRPEFQRSSSDVVS
jgi:hypothetical protein